MGSGNDAKHKKSLPNERQQEPKGAARSAAPLGRRRRRALAVFPFVRISYVFGAFPGPCWTSTAPLSPSLWELRPPQSAPHLYSGTYSTLPLEWNGMSFGAKQKGLYGTELFSERILRNRMTFETERNRFFYGTDYFGNGTEWFIF